MGIKHQRMIAIHDWQQTARNRGAGCRSERRTIQAIIVLNSIVIIPIIIKYEYDNILRDDFLEGNLVCSMLQNPARRVPLYQD